jgi:phenylpropionate dioxygenase-like ring-hydroxylating dioxygenase large terminal subunit
MTFAATLLQAFALPGLFYPVLLSSQLGRTRPLQVTIDNTKLVVFRNASGHAVAHMDACPHQGASFSKRGWCQKGKMMCGYHGFAFDNGRHGKFQLPLVDTLETDGLLYIRKGEGATAKAGIGADKPFAVPEATNPNFRVIRGSRRIFQNHECITFNILDLLHLAYVHNAFGNRRHATPTEFIYETLSEGHGRSIFKYIPRLGSLSTWLGADDVTVENEFALPSTTVTRVGAGRYTKTVVTRAVSVNEGETVLFWEMYRDFLNDGCGVCDEVMRWLMERTLDEDVRMLAQVDARRRTGPLRSRFDVTIDEYRRALAKYGAGLFDRKQNNERE